MVSNTVFFNEDYMVETFFDVIPFNIYVVDVKTHRLIFLNRIAKRALGDLTGQTCYQAIYKEDAPCIHCKISETLNEQGLPSGKSIIYEHFNALDDHWYQIQDKALHWPNGNVVMCSIAVDVSELKATQNRLAEAHAELALKNKQLQALSVTDALTGLHNRLKLDETFTQELERSQRYGRPFSIIMADIDQFKTVNDLFGHTVGDAVLKDTAQLLKSQVRKTDVPGRWGGEEFMVICPETPLQGAANLAEHLRQATENHDYPCDKRLTISFGVAQHREGESVVELVQRADRALYKAKEKGRNLVQIEDAP